MTFLGVMLVVRAAVVLVSTYKVYIFFMDPDPDISSLFLASFFGVAPDREQCDFLSRTVSAAYFHHGVSQRTRMCHARALHAYASMVLSTRAHHRCSL